MSAPPPEPPPPDDRLAAAARRAADRAREGARTPEPSLGTRLGQIGVLGWMIVIPTLGAVLVGRWLDRLCGTGVLFSAALVLIGVLAGFRFAWTWMHRQ